MLLLLAFQAAGEICRVVLHLPLPGPVIGMALLAVALLLRRRGPGPGLQTTADGLLAWLGLLFVPAGVGVVANGALLRASWMPITVALVVSTVSTLAATGVVMNVLGRRSAAGQKS